MTCWPLSTSSPVSRSRNAVARPPSSPRASSTSTRSPASASAVAAANPAMPAPATAMSNGFMKRGEYACPSKRSAAGDRGTGPGRRGDQRALRTRHADDAAEDVVVGRFDPAEDSAIDRTHDPRRDQPARVDPGQRGVGAAVVVAGALRLEREQLFDRRRADSVSGVNRLGAEVSLAAIEAREIFERDVDAPPLQITRH